MLIQKIVVRLDYYSFFGGGQSLSNSQLKIQNISVVC